MNREELLEEIENCISDMSNANVELLRNSAVDLRRKQYEAEDLTLVKTVILNLETASDWLKVPSPERWTKTRDVLEAACFTLQKRIDAGR